MSHINYFHFINKCSTDVEFFLPSLLFPSPPSELGIRILISLHSLCSGILQNKVESRFSLLSQSSRGLEGGMNWEIKIDVYILLCIKQITSENLLYNIGNSVQCSAVT